MLMNIRSEVADGPQAGPRPQRPVRVIVATIAVLVGVGWALVLAQPDTPGSTSPEAGYLLAHRMHAAQTVSALDALLDELGADSSHAGSLVSARDAHERAIVAIEEQLRSWGVRDLMPTDPVSWMGHVLPGEIPGDFDPKYLGVSDRALVAEVTGDLIGGVDGATVMARSVLGLSGHSSIETGATRDLAVDEELRDTLQRVRLDAGLLPAVAITPMTTDPGELDHGGDPVDSFGQALGGAVRLMPLLLAAAALVGSLAPGVSGGPRGRLVIAGVLSIGAGLLHGGLIGPHHDESVISGVFFVAVALAQVGIGGLLVAGRPLLAPAAAMHGGVILVYGAFRLVPAPGLVGPATLDLNGLVTLGLQLLVIAVWVIDTTDLFPRIARVHAEISESAYSSVDQ